jgi:predicted nucleotidyltransferase
MNIFKDISNKIEQPLVIVFSDIDAIATASGIQFFLIGAKARDIFFTDIYDISTRRATLDVDVAIRVKNWDEFKKLITSLLSTQKFTQDKKTHHRFKHQNSVLVDILPFGEIEKPSGSIIWPEQDEKVMSTIGFDEAWLSSVLVKIRKEPELLVRLAVPAALAIMKLVSWNQMYPERNDDAKDLLFLMKEYINAGNDARLHDEDKDLTEYKDFDYGLASPRLLGRDMSMIASSATQSIINEILEKETASNSQFRLVHDMLGGGFNAGDDFEKTLTLLKQLQLGFQERQRE